MIEIKTIELTDNKQVRTDVVLNRTTERRVESTEMIDILKVEGGEGLFNYSEWLGVTNEPDFIVLPSHHHYYYDEQELKNISTIVTIEKLNQIKNLGEFFETIYRLLPSGSKLVGSFAENRKFININSINSTSTSRSMSKSEALENGIISRNPFINMIFSFFDSRTNKQMNRNGVNDLLESHGFNVLDMTEHNGFTYFYAQKVRVVAE
jgi:hypothetical protein